jgi:hypothetical protein
MLAHGDLLGTAIKVPELDWCAQAVPYYNYLLADAEPGAVLAGGHCIPVRLPQASRFIWHKLYASTQRQGFPEKATKDRQQALVLGALVAESDGHLLLQAFQDAPASMTAAIRPIIGKLIENAAAHPELADLLRACSD